MVWKLGNQPTRLDMMPARYNITASKCSKFNLNMLETKTEIGEGRVREQSEEERR